MSKYTMGVDLANGTDHTAYTVVRHRKIRWYHFLLEKLHLIKHLPSPIEVVDAWTIK